MCYPYCNLVRHFSSQATLYLETSVASIKCLVLKGHMGAIATSTFGIGLPDKYFVVAARL